MAEIVVHFREGKSVKTHGEKEDRLATFVIHTGPGEYSEIPWANVRYIDVKEFE